MLQRFFAHLLLIILLANSLQTVVIYTAFKLNQEYIAEVLCINKNNKKAVDCKGSCQLKKQISKSNENRHSDADQLTEIKEVLQFFSPIESLNPQFFITKKPHKTPVAWALPLQEFFMLIEHPPTLS